MLSGARIATLVLFFAIAVVATFATVDRARSGKPSATLVPSSTSSNKLFTVRDAPKGDPLHRGDRISIDDPQTLAAYSFGSLASGTTFRVRRLSPLPKIAIAEPLVPVRRPSYAYFVLPVQVMFLIIAAVVAARGTSKGSLSLAWLFALIVLLVNPTSPSWPKWLVLIFGLSGDIIAIIAFACASDFAALFTGEADAAWSLRYRRIALGFAIASAAISLPISILSFSVPEMPSFLGYVAFATLVVQSIVCMIGLAFAYFKAPRAERQKATWVVASLGVGVFGFLATVLLSAAEVAEPGRDIPLLFLIAMPLGCAYAILRYRLLDIGFVVNRAAVFGVTSLLVLASLAVVDLVLQHLLGSWLVVSGSYVQLGIALAIGVATRPLHGRVDGLVDDLFFRARHEAERILRAFEHDVAHIDDATLVRARTVAIVARVTALRCAFYVANEKAFACAASSDYTRARPLIHRNDGAVVRLITTRLPVDLHDVETVLDDDFAFPMFARNRLLGILVCGGKIDGVTAYAPDELATIGAVAHAAGVALDLLRTDALESELLRVRAELETVRPVL